MQTLTNHRGTQISLSDSATGRKTWAFFWNGLETAVVYAQWPMPASRDQETYALHIGNASEHSRDVAEMLMREFIQTGNGKFTSL